MTIELDLSSSGIQSAIDKLEQYKQGLERKNDLFVKALANTALPEIRNAMSSGSGDSDREYRTEIKTSGASKVVKGSLALFNSDILFWEFGSGVYYNNGNPNPYATKMGMGPGTYPGQTHVPDPGYWYYKPDGSNTSVRSYGTEATMPMYYSVMEMKRSVGRVAREVFGNGK